MSEYRTKEAGKRIFWLTSTTQSQLKTRLGRDSPTSLHLDDPKSDRKLWPEESENAELLEFLLAQFLGV